MGKLRFSKLIKFFAIALLGTATAIAAIAVMSSPVTAQAPGGGGGRTLKPWDTDNLRIGSTYSAKSFNIPFHKYGGYSGVSACQSSVADGFFQTDNSVVNDFPVLVSSGSGDSVTWSIAAGSAGNNAGCDTFVAQQDRLAAQVASGMGYALDESGGLRAFTGGSPFTTGRSAADLTYVAWTAKASSGYTIVGTHGATTDIRYLRRVDGFLNELQISPSSAAKTITVPDTSIKNGDFGTSWHGKQVGSDKYNIRAALYPSLARHLTKAKSDDLCPNWYHPRGEDSHQRIGGSTGRSLTGLSHANAQIADRFWCRGDVREKRRFAVEVHDLPDGIIAFTGAPASGTFIAYGRLGCYYTSTGGQVITGTTAQKCSYNFPLPKCDPNPGNGSDTDWREYTNAEIRASVGGSVFGQPFNKAAGADCSYVLPRCIDKGSIRDMTPDELAQLKAEDPSFTPRADGLTTCPKQTASLPPSLPGFSDDACVTASLVIGENRIAGSAAEPGVPASDRTLVVAAGRTAWDLDITLPHHNTASPPRDTTSTPADATGCADGSEDRADHSSDAGSAARKNTDAGADLVLPVSSVAAQSTHPPHSKGFDSAGTDYTSAVRNIAHRYASNVAENTCAAKLAEAEMVLSEMKARRLAFQRYIDSYQSRIDAALSTSAAEPLSFGNYSTNTQPGSDLGVDVLRYNAIEANHLAYVNARKDHLEFLETAVDKAETQYSTDTSGLSVPSAVPNNGCVARYDSAITALRDKIDDAESDFATVARTAGRKSVSGHLSDFNRVNLAADPAAARVVVPNVSRPAYSWSDGSSSTAYSCPSGGRLNSSKSTCTPTITERLPANSLTTSGTRYETNDDTAECLKNPPDPLVWLWSLACYDQVPYSYTTYSCPAVGEGEVAWVLSGIECIRNVDGTPYTSTVTVTTSQSYSVTDTGTVKGYFPSANSSPDKSQTFTVTFTGTRTKTVVNSGTATYSNRTDSNNYATKSKAAEDIVKGSPPKSQSALPGFTEPSITAHTDISNLSLLGKYHTQHPDRANLKATAAADRDTAAANLGSLSAGNITTAATGATTTPQTIANTNVPTSWGGTGTTAASRRSDLQTETNDYKTAYTGAYNTAYSAALADMGSTATTTTWNNFDWRYQQSTLAWGNYQEDPATTYSASAATPRDGTGCDLVNVASDGTVSVEATRLDYETSSYGKGSVYSARTDAQRTCKIRRTRTPELILEYQPSRPSGTDESKAVSSFYVNYQPTPAAERFKLYDEAEVFAVKTSLADSNPVLCYQPGEALVAHVAAKGIDAVNKAVFRNASGFAGGSKRHCYRHPSLAQLVSSGKSQTSVRVL